MRHTIHTLTLAASLGAASAPALLAQSYTLVDLAPSSKFSTANGISDAGVAGYSAPSISLSAAHATLWDGANQFDLHPALADAGAGTGRSSLQAIAGGIQVGWAAGTATPGGRPVPVLWHGTADSAFALPIPFVNAGGQALATDGIQVAGYATPLNRDGTTFGVSRAVVWDVASGAGTDLGDGGGGAQAVAVGGGSQVGYVVKGNINAALWRGSASSLTILHPKSAVASQAYGTDGARQVGYSGYDVRVRVEAVKGAKTTRFNYATVWTGTAASAAVIHPFGFSHSFAVSVSGPWIAGYGTDQAKLGTPAYYHAVVWDANNQATDLGALLPAGFVGSQALSVDANGNVAGYMNAADGTRHAVVWLRQVAP